MYVQHTRTPATFFSHSAGLRMRFPTLSSVSTLPQMCQSRFSFAAHPVSQTLAESAVAHPCQQLSRAGGTIDIAALYCKGYIVDAIGGYLAKDEMDMYRLMGSLWREDCRTMGRKTLRSSTVWAVADGIDPATLLPLQVHEGGSAV